MSTLPYARSTEEIPLMRFEKSAIEDKIASDQVGEVIYMDVIKVYLRAPGDMRTETPEIAMRTEYDSIEKEIEVEEEIPRKFINKDGNPDEKIERVLVKRTETFFKPKTVFPWLDNLKQQLRDGHISQTQHDKMKSAFDHFMSQTEAPIDGTPLSAWSGVNPSIKARLLSMGIVTVERLAELPEEGLIHVGMGARDAKNSAISYLQKVGSIDKGATAAVKAEQENAELKKNLESLTAQVAQLTALQEKQQDISAQTSAKKRGRPAKDKEAA